MSVFHLDKILNLKDKLVVAFSGGLDSTVLLHQLWKWHQIHSESSLRALHVHHNISPNADNWAKHCMMICKTWKLNCNILYITINSKNYHNDGGIEAAARKARYSILINELKHNEILVTAHHLNDQCETLLLALKRGSGPTGLSAMQKKGYINNHVLLRPLLDISHEILENYAKDNHLFWIEDESNYDLRFDRNFLRQKILPVLVKRWPYFINTTTRSAKLCNEQEVLLDELLHKELEELIQDDGSLLFTKLLMLSKVHMNALLRRWFKFNCQKMPSYNTLNSIYKELMLSRKDAQPRLQLGNNEVRRFRQKLYLLPLQNSLRNIKLYWNDLKKPLVLPQNLGILSSNFFTKVLRLPTINEVVYVKFYLKGRINILNSIGSRKIKKIWQKLNVPPWKREQIPFIFYNQIFICAPNFFISIEGKRIDDNGWNIIWNQ